MKLRLNRFREVLRAVFHARPEETAKLESDGVKRLVRGIVTTRLDEIGCDACFEQLDRFVEMKLAGRDVAQAMSLVQDHLERCRDCHEEYEALLTALRAIA